jgi:hypothetical protein
LYSHQSSNLSRPKLRNPGEAGRWQWAYHATEQTQFVFMSIYHNATRMKGLQTEPQRFSPWLSALVVTLAAGLARVSVGGAVPEIFSSSNILPPPGGVYISPADWHVAYSQGIVIRGVQHRGFTRGLTAPTGAATQAEVFNSTLAFQISTDNGVTYSSATASALVGVNVTHTGDVGVTSYFSTEMTGLSFSVVVGAQTIMVRASTALPSLGQTTVRPVSGGGYMISSFFDIFTELSLDGGQSWSAGQQAAHVELRNDPALVPSVPEPTSVLPPLNDQYISPGLYHALYAQGIVIKDVRHRLFSVAYPPPAAGAFQVHNFNSTLDMSVSLDGGATFQSVQGAAPVTVSVSGTGAGNSGLFDTEMTALSFTTQIGAQAIMVRESPSEASLGETQITPQPDGTFRISSFFDIFTELSLDGGATWQPASNGPVRMQLAELAPEQSSSVTNTLPPANGAYVSPDQWHALYAQGIILSNVSHLEFTKSQPPPPPGGTVTETFNSFVNGLISLNNGASFQSFSSPAVVTVKVTSRPDLDNGNIRYFDTEMLQLDLTGLPGGVLVRESPTKASLGRTSIRQEPATGQYRISSFFDVFTEVSLDNGTTWSPAQSGAVGVRLKTPATPITLVCPANLSVTAAGAAGAIVALPTPTISGGCSGAVSWTYSPPSGSLFPIGVTTVTATAMDSCGNVQTCSFTVTVNPPTTSVPEVFFPKSLLPPPTGTYISPAQYHVLFANGIVIRDVRHHIFSVALSSPALGDSSIDTFNSEVDCEISFNNGQTYQPVSATGMVTVRVTHAQDSGGVSYFDTEMLGLELSLAAGAQVVKLRESPTLVSHGQTTTRPVAGGFMISSFFDVFTEVSLDSGNTWSPSTGAGHVELRGDPSQVPPVPEPTPLLPPPNDVYVSPATWHALYAQGIVIKDVRHKWFSTAMQPPSPGAATVESFNSLLDFQVSFDNGVTFQPVHVTAPVVVQVSNNSYGSDDILDNLMVSMNFTATVSTASILLRVSPSLPSRGETEMKQQADGTYRISSFFDVFTEISLDGGGTWSPSSTGPVRVNLASQATEHSTTSPNLPPLNEAFAPPPTWYAVYPNGIIVSNVELYQLGPNLPPPPTGAQPQTFAGLAAMSVVLPGNPTPMQVSGASVSGFLLVSNKLSFGNTRFFDVFLQNMVISGSNLPTGLQIRATPNKSVGRTSVRQESAGGPYHISSFFDVFTDLSLDSGHTWSSATTVPAPVGTVPVPPAPFVISCPSNITVYASSPAGAYVTYAIPPITFYPDCPFGPFSVTGNPASGSLFPVGSTTVTLTGSDGCGEHPTCTFTVTVLPRKWYWGLNYLPPLNGQFVGPSSWQGSYGSGIVVSNPVLRTFGQSFPPPLAGQVLTDSFPAQMTFQLSTDSGRTFQRQTGLANLAVMLSNGGPQGNDQVYPAQVLTLSFGSNSPLPMLRQSPTLPSTGETRISPIAGGGYQISSFFDVFTEISLDHGTTWTPGTPLTHMELQPDAASTSMSIGKVSLVNGNPAFPVQTQAGLLYLLQFKNSLADPLWFTLTGVVGNGQPVTQTDFYGSGRPQRYYRFQVVPYGPGISTGY